jgi:Xaa-Pro aminopeptidase
VSTTASTPNTARRLSNLRPALADQRLDAMVVSTLTNMRYLTAFTGSAGYLVVDHDEARLYVDERYTEQAQQQFTVGRVVTTARDILGGVLEALKGARMPLRLGFESNTLPHAEWKRLADGLSGAEGVPTAGVVERLRSRKDAQEVDAIRQAVAITDRAYQDFLSWIAPGMKESEVAARCEFFQRMQGGDRKETRTAVGSGPRSSMPHCIATDRVIGPNEPVMLDIGCLVDGYTSDLTRTVWLGTPPKEFEAMYRAVGDAQHQAIASIKAGVSGREIHQIARDHLMRHGFPDLPHSLGHSLGLNIHERPSFSATETARVESGNVVTVEPGIYLSGRYGLRTEDVIVVTDNGCEVLSIQERELQTR